MKNDIVQRLHRSELRIEQGINELCGEAAAEITRLTEALRLQMEAKHKEAAEAKLWFSKAQEWKEALRAAEDREKALREERDELLAQISDCRGSHWLGRQDRKGVTPHLDAIWRGLVEVDDARQALAGAKP